MSCPRSAHHLSLAGASLAPVSEHHQWASSFKMYENYWRYLTVYALYDWSWRTCAAMFKNRRSRTMEGLHCSCIYIYTSSEWHHGDGECIPCTKSLHMLITVFDCFPSHAWWGDGDANGLEGIDALLSHLRERRSQSMSGIHVHCQSVLSHPTPHPNLPGHTVLHCLRKLFA